MKNEMKESHWIKGDVYQKIMDALKASSLNLEQLTLDDLSPVDHFHARGKLATQELADRINIMPGQKILDIGSGLGGPARYLSNRFQCLVDGVDITPEFVLIANKLNELVKMQEQVSFKVGDGRSLPYDDNQFSGVVCQHVTMNIEDRAQFFKEVNRVLKQGAFFALSEHGMGATANPVFPVPWSEDGQGSFLVTPDETVRLLTNSGFETELPELTAKKYLKGYSKMSELMEQGNIPVLGTHLLLGDNCAQKIKNAARNIAENRTSPFMLVAYKRQ